MAYYKNKNKAFVFDAQKTNKNNYFAVPKCKKTNKIHHRSVSSTLIEKPTPLQAQKYWGWQLSHHVISIEGCLGLQKNLGSRPVNIRNTTVYPFW